MSPPRFGCEKHILFARRASPEIRARTASRFHEIIAGFRSENPRYDRSLRNDGEYRRSATRAHDNAALMALAKPCKRVVRQPSQFLDCVEFVIWAHAA